MINKKYTNSDDLRMLLVEYTEAFEKRYGVVGKEGNTDLIRESTRKFYDLREKQLEKPG